jgi:hypothetical protein
MGVFSKELKKLPGKTLKEKLEKLKIKVGPKVTMEEAIKLLKKRIRH